MGDTTDITERRSFAYDSTNKVARTGTALEPVNLAILMEYLLLRIIAPMRIQIYTGIQTATRIWCKHLCLWKEKHVSIPRSKLIQAIKTDRNFVRMFTLPLGKKMVWLTLITLEKKMSPLMVPTETVRLHFSNKNTRATPDSVNGMRRRR